MELEIEYLNSRPDPAVALKALTEHVNKNIAQPLRDLEQGIKGQGRDVAHSTLTRQSTDLAVVDAAVQTGLPPEMAALGTVAVITGDARFQSHRKKKARIKQAPAGYLLEVKRDSTQSRVEAIRAKLWPFASGR